MADWGLLVENYYKRNRRWNSSKIDKLILEVLSEEESLVEASTLNHDELGPDKLSRIELFADKIIKGEPFVLVNGEEVGLPKEENSELLARLKAALNGEPISGKLYAITSDGQRINTNKLKKTGEFGGGKGAGIKPNRGEISEAFVAAAVTLRFLHLPETAKMNGETGEIEPAKGLVKPEEVKDFLINGYGGKKIIKKDESTIEFQNSISPGQVNDKQPTDTIRMEVGLRRASMKGLMEIDDPKSFVNTDGELKKFLEAACNYANKEIIKWAIGVTQDASGEADPEAAMGFFINEYDNTINIEGVGTGNQKLTKVDLQMTCTGEGCPATGVSIDGAGDVGSEVKQLARLSLKAGSISHFGGGAATSPENAMKVLQSVFPVGDKDTEFKGKMQAWMSEQTPEKWGMKTVKTKKGTIKKVFDKEAANVDEVAKYRSEALRDLLRRYFEHVTEKMGSLGQASEPIFLEKMVKGLLNHSVKGTKDEKSGKDYSKETGVILVQSTGAGDFFKIDFNALDDAFGDGTDWAASQVGDKNPYLAIWTQHLEDENGNKVKNIEAPANIRDPKILFTLRMLGRHPSKGGEILRLEKGPLMKKIAAVPQGEKLIYRDGKLVAVPDENK